MPAISMAPPCISESGISESADAQSIGGGFAMFAPPIVQEEMSGTTLFRSARSDEDGGNPANIAASGASNQNTA